jgi:hypothetical protein
MVDHMIEMDFRNHYGDRVMVLTCPVKRVSVLAVPAANHYMQCPYCGAQA